jgi:hypothetical protein
MVYLAWASIYIRSYQILSRNVMDRDEFERLKEAEKEHLRKLNKIKGELSHARKSQGLRRAIHELESSLSPDSYDEMLERVQHETVTNEARLDMAMENRALPELDEEAARAARAARAAELVRQMKIAMGGLSDEESPSASASSQPDENLPEKTIGRMMPEVEASSTDDAAPEKTIGRMPTGDDPPDA